MLTFVAIRLRALMAALRTVTVAARDVVANSSETHSRGPASMSFSEFK